MRFWLTFVLLMLLVFQGLSQPIESILQDSISTENAFKRDSVSFFSDAVRARPSYLLLPESHCRYFPIPSLLDPDLALRWPCFTQIRKDGIPLKRNLWKDWLMIFLILLALLASAGLRVHPDVLQPLTWLIKKPSTYTERWRDDIQPVHVLFNFIFFCVIALLAWFSCHRLLDYPFKESALPVFVLVVAAIYGAKSIFYRTTGLLFGFKEALLSYLNIVFKINRCLGLMLLPLVFWMFFSTPFWAKWSLFISIGLFFLFTGLRFVRGMQLGGQLMTSRIHFLFYLCASELLPTLVLIKFLLNE